MVLVAMYSCSRTVGQSPPSPPQTSQSASKEGEPIHIEGEVTTGLLIKKVNPEYPTKARRKRTQGTVILRAVISKEGDIVDLSVVSGDPLLVKSALKAVKQWKYKPYFFQGKPVEVDTEIRVNYALSGG
jgi:protein TonB